MSYEDYARLMNTMIIKEDIPDVITEEWLKESLKNNMFRIWGFSFVDLSNKKFDENISKEILDKISFSTKTIFPKDSPIVVKDSMYKLDDAIIRLHEQGINGEGINVAVIDQEFTFIHEEIKDALLSYKSFSNTPSNDMHGIVVSSNMVGKNIGIAPSTKLYYFATNHKETYLSTIKALEEIYELNEKGVNIRVVSISSGGHWDIEEADRFFEIKAKLEKQGCYVIDSVIFGEDFTCVNIDDDTGRLYYSEWQKDRLNHFRNKLGIIAGGKMVAFAPSGDNLDYYFFTPESSYSWAIPKLSGLFTLALQIKQDLTYDDFVELSKNSKIVTKEGVNILNIIELFCKIRNLDKDNMINVDGRVI